MKNLLYILLFLAPFSTSSQNVLNLQEVLQIGLEYNFDIQIVRNEARISSNNVTRGNAGFLPTVGISGGYSARVSNANQFPRNADEVTRIRNSQTHSLDAGVSLNWTIFEGFRVQTNYRRLQELQTIGELNVRLTIENLISNLTAEYYNYVHQHLRLITMQQAVALSRERLRIVEAHYQVGSRSMLDVRQARVDFNADSAQLILQHEVLIRSQIRLNELMGIDVNTQFEPEASSIEFNPFLIRDDLQASMMQYNTLLQLTDQSRVLSELELRMLESRNFPFMRLNTGYGFSNLNYNRGTLDRQRTWGPNVGITIGYTLFDGFNRRREQQNARIVIENRELEIARRTQWLQSDFANMWVAYQNNIELVHLEVQSVENARLNYEIAMERFLLGDLGGFQLREAQNGLMAAEQRLLTARYRTKLYEISLLQISGRIGEFLE